MTETRHIRTSLIMSDDSSRSTPGKLTKIPNIEEKLLDGIAAGRSLKSLGEEFNVSDQAVYRRLIEHPDYKPRQAVGLELRMDRRECQLEEAETNVHVTRADRLLGHARWLAERCAPDRFGQKTMLTGADGGPIQVQIVRFAGKLIEGEVVDKSVDKGR